MLRSIVLALSVVGLATPVAAATVSITCGSVGAEQTLCREAVKDWEAATGHEVQVVAPPTSTSDQLALYQQMLNSGSGDID
ncbi:MAG: ABC transporter substrate-binding protein, partial [Inquilinus sp.]|nr:ABC transporter substrate-binding protein [Inquilinus sp.]